jgi:hypothetical protein
MLLIKRQLIKQDIIKKARELSRYSYGLDSRGSILGRGKRFFSSP